ncbi:Ribosome biogenesis GTP-binding protein YsxC [Alteracholeplasma palmae J233]|uniref:Probable GTP-binding protein EngB n=1 Tax=Alteracholeplasma palmae (strain ATCC 49389 / J233) TaxID=1318466 RepID=U4KL50_ALTPJ|nr:ribosome biogenesis GTP-binding protein YihA/YsxC [Alteracholeplasma palmae]CCV64487.1 Ribosome biogenesis GTP-binding protein YsxC [Alteracholeplasma palmae J233]
MIKHAEFIKSITDIKDAPDTNLPEIVLVGRSNVGKSSFINGIANRKSIARVSATPGKTITLNYYMMDNSFYLVDAPGYGYARRSKSLQQTFIQMLLAYLELSPNLKKVFQFIDFKVGPTEDDLEMYDALLEGGFDVSVIVTKKDKVKSSLRSKHEKMIKDKMNQPEKIFITSSQTKDGYDKVYQEMILTLE